LVEHTQRADLIILDNLSALVRSGLENQAESWLPIQQWALELRRQGKSVVFVHHSGRNGEARGTSKREDLLDTVISLRAPHSAGPNHGLKAEIHFTKFRGFFGEDALPFEASMSTGEDGLPLWTMSDIELSGYERAAELFAEGCDVLAVKEELGISRATAFRWRHQWKQSQESHDDETE
jgi:putative DNA primase/helicase